MKKKCKIFILAMLFFAAIFFLVLFLKENTLAVLTPKGMIALKEKRLLTIATVLMLIIVVPVFILATVISWRYREGNDKAKYSPKWDKSHLAESIWWGFPFVIVAILAVFTWKGCHELDPFKPITSDKKPLTVQVVALQWKWLFIYPEQGVASVNFVQFPEKRPINFEITSDAPMNSFWIPQLGGQIYAMAGMNSKLHLIADEVGIYRGASSNISGNGFAGMVFTAKSTTEEDFEDWVASVKALSNEMNWDVYKELVKPSEYVPVELFSLKDEGLYDQIIMQYMAPSKAQEEMGCLGN
jgi:cytochrome o ubiquinol oxidase subunit II